MDTKVSDLNNIDIVAPKPRKACNSSSLSCSYCKQDPLHPSHQNSDWSSEDWKSNKAKAKEQGKSPVDFNDPKPQTSEEQTTDIDKVAFSKLQTGHSDLKGEPLEVMKSLIPPPSTKETLGNMTENTGGEGLMEVERRLQREKKRYEVNDRIYMG